MRKGLDKHIQTSGKAVFKVGIPFALAKIQSLMPGHVKVEPEVIVSFVPTATLGEVYEAANCARNRGMSPAYSEPLSDLSPCEFWHSP
jgi:hypothetical protein